MYTVLEKAIIAYLLLRLNFSSKFSGIRTPNPTGLSFIGIGVLGVGSILKLYKVCNSRFYFKQREPIFNKTLNIGNK